MKELKESIFSLLTAMLVSFLGASLCTNPALVVQQNQSRSSAKKQQNIREVVTPTAFEIDDDRIKPPKAFVYYFDKHAAMPEYIFHFDRTTVSSDPLGDFIYKQKELASADVNKFQEYIRNQHQFTRAHETALRQMGCAPNELLDLRYGLVTSYSLRGYIYEYTPVVEAKGPTLLITTKESYETCIEKMGCRLADTAKVADERYINLQLAGFQRAEPMRTLNLCSILPAQRDALPEKRTEYLKKEADFFMKYFEHDRDNPLIRIFEEIISRYEKEKALLEQQVKGIPIVIWYPAVISKIQADDLDKFDDLLPDLEGDSFDRLRLFTVSLVKYYHDLTKDQIVIANIFRSAYVYIIRMLTLAKLSNK